MALRLRTRKIARTSGSGDDERRALTVAGMPPAMLRPTGSGMRVTRSNALAIADVYAAVRVLADAVASLPLVAYRRIGEGQRQRMDGGPLVELLRRPSPTQTRSGLMGTLMAHLQIHGNAYVGLYRGADGGIEQLALMPPERMAVELRAGRLHYEFTDQHGARFALTDTDLIHVRGLSVDGLMGLSVVEQAREALGLSAALTAHAASFMKNDARPSGILRLGHTTPERQKEIGEAWRDRYAGANSAGIAVVTGEVHFEQVASSAAEAQLVEQRQQSTAEIARVFRIPPSLLGAPTGSSMTYGNREADAAYFVANSLRPWLVAIEDAFNAHDELLPAGQFVEFLLEGLLRGDSTSRAAFYAAALDPQTGWMSRKEVRRLENLPPEPAPAVIPQEEPTHV